MIARVARCIGVLVVVFGGSIVAPALFSASPARVISAHAVRQQQPVFSSRVDAVRVDVLVTEGGKPVRGLQPGDFEVRDNGVLQSVNLVSLESLPTDVVLAFDSSSSIAGARLGQLRSASDILLDELKNGDRVALVTFSHVARVGSALTSDLGGVRTALERLVAEGDTALHDGTYLALAMGEATTGRSLLLVFSEGVDTSSWLSGDAVVEAAKRTQMTAYAVSVAARGKGPGFLRDLCAATGGRLIELESTWNLSSTFLDLLDEFRTRYLLSYVPRGVSADGWHQLNVRVKRRAATVVARSGYFAGM